MSIEAWFLMGRKIDWNALSIIAEKLGIEDVDRLIDDCVLMRNHEGTDAGSI